MSEERANGDNLHCHVRRWAEWPKDELAQELRHRLHYHYAQTDGTMIFPNSAEGDMLKMVHVFLTPNVKGDRT